MALGPRLEFRQGQSLVITPQLQQAIKLLQLSNVELEAYLSPGPTAEVLTRHADSARRLARLGALHVGEPAPAGCAVTVAAGAEIAIPIRSILHDQQNARVILGDVVAIDHPVAVPTGSWICHGYTGTKPYGVPSPVAAMIRGRTSLLVASSCAAAYGAHSTGVAIMKPRGVRI